MTTWLRKLRPILATWAYLSCFTLVLLQGTVWSTGESEVDVIRVLLASLPFSVLAFVFAGERNHALWLWAMCGLLNGVLIYLIAIVSAKPDVRVAKWKAVTRALSRCAGTALAIGAVCVFLVPDVRVSFFGMLFPGVCLTDELSSIANLSGMI